MTSRLWPTLSFYLGFIASLNRAFKASRNDRACTAMLGPRMGTRGDTGAKGRPRKIREGAMARLDIADADLTALGQSGADVYFELAMMYATGRSVPADLVSAHKWFNIAAVRGNAAAARLRREIAAEMSDAEIAAAQRAARDWLAKPASGTRNIAA